MKYMLVYTPDHDPCYSIGILGVFESEDDASLFINELRLEGHQSKGIEIIEVKDTVKQALRTISQTDAGANGLYF